MLEVAHVGVNCHECASVQCEAAMQFVGAYPKFAKCVGESHEWGETVVAYHDVQDA